MFNGTVHFHLCFNPASYSTWVRHCWNYLLLLHIFHINFLRYLYVLTSCSAKPEDIKLNEPK